PVTMPAPWRSSVRILGSDCYRRIVSLKKGSLHEIDYTVRVPYTSWMRNAGLSLRQISRDCCRGEVLTDEVLTADLALVPPCVKIAGEPTAAIYNRYNKEIRFLIPEDESGISQFRQVLVASYASPEGSYQHNETLSRQRAEEFRTYISRRYLSEGCPVICGSVAEDWRNCAAWSLFPANPMRKQSVSSSTTTASSKAAKPT
ncbi:hypothetical protein, partial [Parabacteroides goldsteinii]|uniref:hypothetical protein n=4 Tax=Parabacteroides goldsteinii TaxID=328812 RepID=UPI002575D691